MDKETIAEKKLLQFLLTKADSIKEEYLSHLNYQNKLSLLKSITNDEIKFQHLEEFAEVDKLNIVLSMEDETIIIKSIPKIHNQQGLQFIILKLKSEITRLQVISKLLPPYKTLIENIQNHTFLNQYPFEPSIDPSLKIGLEIEAEGQSSPIIMQYSLPNGWLSKEEKTINDGIEINSPPMYYNQNNLSDVVSICNFLKSYQLETTSKCALHLHIEATALESLEAWQLFKYIYCNCEKIIYLISNPKWETPRQGIKTYAKPVSKNWTSIPEKYQIKEELVDSLIDTQYEELDDIRFYAVNLSNVGGKTNTIEFRHGNSSLNSEDVILFINLFASLVSTANRLSSKITSEENNHLNNLCHSDELVKLKSLLELLFQNEQLKLQYYERYIINSQIAKNTNNCTESFSYGNIYRS